MRTPRGFLRREIDFCHCDIEGDKLLCLARAVENDLPHPTRCILFPEDTTATIPFAVWIRQLALDLSYADPIIGLRAIMEDWSREKILTTLRKRGESKL